MEEVYISVSHLLLGVIGYLMSPWALLMTAASFIYAVQNHFDEWLLKYLSRGQKETGIEEDKGGSEHTAVGAVVIFSGLFAFITAACLAGWAQWTNTNLLEGVSSTQVAQGMLVGALEMFWLVPYLYATNRAGAVAAAPLFQIVPVVSLLLELLFFGQMPPLWHVVGAMVITVGGFTLNWSPATNRIDLTTIALMTAASLIIAAIYFIFKDAASEGNFIPTAFWSAVGNGLMTLILLIVWKPYRKEFLTTYQESSIIALLGQFINEVLNISSVLISQKAMILGPSIMAVTALNAYQPIFILLLGWVLAVAKKQKAVDGKLYNNLIDTARKATSIVLIATGTVLIAT